MLPTSVFMLLYREEPVEPDASSTNAMSTGEEPERARGSRRGSRQGARGNAGNARALTGVSRQKK